MQEHYRKLRKRRRRVRVRGKFTNNSEEKRNEIRKNTAETQTKRKFNDNEADVIEKAKRREKSDKNTLKSWRRKSLSTNHS